jgi:hypothetical protein
VGALVSLFITISLSLLITRIAAVALTLTGLSRDSARFQARSAFTGVGFTTNEAEQVVSHPVRRRILMLLMLLGNAGVITVVSSLVLTFVGTTNTHGRLIRLAIIILGLGLIWLLSTSNWLDQALSRVINWALKHWTELEVRDYTNLLHLSGDYQVTAMRVDADDWWADKRLSELHLRDEGVIVLGVQRQDGTYIGAPRGKTRIRPHDLLILYGRTPTLSDLDSRQANLSGEYAHQDAVAAQDQVESEQEQIDTESQKDR